MAYRGSADRDGRVAVVRLTDDGQAVVKRFEENLEARLSGLVADWPAKEREAAAAALVGLVHSIHGDMASEDMASEKLTANGEALAPR